MPLSQEKTKLGQEGVALGVVQPEQKRREAKEKHEIQRSRKAEQEKSTEAEKQGNKKPKRGKI